MVNRVLRVDVTEVSQSDYNAARKQAPRIVMERKTDEVDGFVFRVEKGEYKLYVRLDNRCYVGDMGSYSPHDFVKFKFRKLQTITTVVFDNPDFIMPEAAPEPTPKRRSNAA